MRPLLALGPWLFSLAFSTVGSVYTLAACNTADLQTADGGSSSGLGDDDDEPVTLRLGNFNVRNLFNDKDDSDTQVEESVVSSADYQEHLRGVASSLKLLDAEVVVLIEVENQAVLDDLTARREIAGKYPYSAILPGNDPRGINVAVISSLPIERTKTHANDSIRGDLAGKTYRYARDVPEYHFTKSGQPFTLLGIHFKAFEPNGTAAETRADDDKRLAEARGARAIADGLLADAANGPVVLLGDFNADVERPSTQAIECADPAYSNATSDRSAADRWTVDYGDGKLTYDDQWSSPALAATRVAASVTLLRNEAVSDHAAVGATYALQ